MKKPKENKSHGHSKEDKGRTIRDTADVVAVIRCHEAAKEKPLVDDPFAHLFVTPQGEALLEAALTRWSFFAEYLLVRIKFFDDRLRDFCAQKEPIEQIVILGAGNDMRALRLPFLERKKIFEVDYPDRITYKKNLLKESLHKLPANTIYVGADIKQDRFLEVLHGAGLAVDKKTAFIMEGLIYYLGSSGVDHLFDELSRLSPRGSLFLLDHISQDMTQTSHDPEKRTRYPYPQDPHPYLTQKGFAVIESVLLGDLTEHYFGRSYQERWWALTCKLP